MEQMREVLKDFHELYTADKLLTEALTPELTDTQYKQRVELSAWTMLSHSLLNLELAKVRR
jgi:Na+/melibiose symporter-like transporter